MKKELQPIIKRFRYDDSRVTLDGPELTREEEQVINHGLVI